MIIKKYIDGLAFFKSGEEVAFYSLINNNIRFFLNKSDKLRSTYEISYEDYLYVTNKIKEYLNEGCK